MKYLPQEIIRRKRDGHPLGQEEIDFFVEGLTSGAISEGQVAAFAMAIYFQGLSREECVALTLAMRDSGDVMAWQDENFDGPVIDKHSTGGVGDLVSLVLGPLLAACGGYVPMISGRGLGHTGGTLDKLESIPGYHTAPDNALFRETVRSAGVAIIGQTGLLAPADGRLYSIRDITATVESIGLITASILSKKLAAGLDALVMDVKVGDGAFMPTTEASRELARSIAEVASAAGTPTTALLTDMNQCLGRNAGNALEVRESIDHLSGAARDARLLDVTMSLAGELLSIGGLSESAEDGRAQAEKALNSGQAAEHFARMVAALGGPADIMEQAAKHLPAAPAVQGLAPDRLGIVTAVDARELGLAIIDLGGGRRRVEDSIDYSVGLSDVAAIGESVGPERPLCIIHAASDADAERAGSAIRAAVTIGDVAPPPAPNVRQRVGPPAP